MKGRILDTNVVSELRKGRRMDVSVFRWQEVVKLEETYLSVVTLAELRAGILKIRKRDEVFAQRLEDYYRRVVFERFKGRVLNVGVAIAEIAGEMSAGRTRDNFDVIIAATAKLYDMTVVTRNVKDFEGLGVELEDPWAG